ncbi:MAG: hypothetical protein D6775_13970 [Caldilineae bacterium]|nr:MAG: hypothetical protein D6775_13970 [Caldilineae bacterium]
MSFFWTSFFGPPLLLVLGGLLLVASGRHLSASRRGLGATWAAGAALVAWFLLRFFAANTEGYWLWSAPFGLDTTLAIQLSGWAWLAGLGILLVLFCAVSLPGWQQEPGAVDGRAWALLLGCCGLLVVLAASWVGLTLVWALMMLGTGLIAGGFARDAARAWSAAILSTFLLLIASLLEGDTALTNVVGAVPLSALGQFLLIMAAMVPLGAYPFHTWLLSPSARAPGRHLTLHIVPALAAIHLLGRFDLPLLSAQAWPILAISSLLGSALVAWAAHDTQRAWSYVLINRASWVLLALAMIHGSTAKAAAMLLLTLAAGSALWAIARVVPRDRRWHLPLLGNMAVLYGLPLTPGFVASTALGRLVRPSLLLAGWLLVLLGQTLFVAALWRRSLLPPEEATDAAVGRPRALVLPMALAAGLALWAGLFPASLYRLIGLETDAVGLFSLWREAGLTGWLTLLLPLAAGLALARSEEKLFAPWRGWQADMARLVGLDWLYGLLSRMLDGLALALGLLADLIDGAGQFGWVLLALLVALALFAS